MGGAGDEGEAFEIVGVAVQVAVEFGEGDAGAIFSLITGCRPTRAPSRRRLIISAILVIPPASYRFKPIRGRFMARRTISTMI